MLYILTGCSWAYNIAAYPSLSINSQVVEQANSALTRIKSSLSYMSPSNFMSHCKLYLWYMNDNITYDIVILILMFCNVYGELVCL